MPNYNWKSLQHFVTKKGQCEGNSKVDFIVIVYVGINQVT